MIYFYYINTIQFYGIHGRTCAVSTLSHDSLRFHLGLLLRIAKNCHFVYESKIYFNQFNFLLARKKIEEWRNQGHGRLDLSLTSLSVRHSNHLS